MAHRTAHRRARKNAGHVKRWAKIGRRCSPKGRARLAKAGKWPATARRDKKGRFLSRKRRKGVKKLRGLASRIFGNPGIGAIGGLPGRILAPFSVGNVKTIGGIGAGAVVTALALRYAPQDWNTGSWGVGLTALVGGAATIAAGMLVPVIAGPVGLGAVAVTLVRALITYVPAAFERIMSPVIEWKAAAAPAAIPAASGTPAGFHAIGGRVAGYLAGKYAPMPGLAGADMFNTRADSAF